MNSSEMLPSDDARLPGLLPAMRWDPTGLY